MILRGPDYIFFIFYEAKARILFQLWVARLFILFTKTARPPLPPPRNQLVVPKTNQEINEPSYEMVGVKITVTNYGQNNRISGIFFLVDFLFSSLITPNVFIVMVLKCTCILIIIYTVYTCDTLVPTRILNSEISWFCFDFPKWGPVSFIITDFNVFVQFFEWTDKVRMKCIAVDNL